MLFQHSVIYIFEGAYLELAGSAPAFVLEKVLSFLVIGKDAIAIKVNNEAFLINMIFSAAH